MATSALPSVDDEARFGNAYRHFRFRPRTRRQRSERVDTSEMDNMWTGASDAEGPALPAEGTRSGLLSTACDRHIATGWPRLQGAPQLERCQQEAER